MWDVLMDNSGYYSLVMAFGAVVFGALAAASATRTLRRAEVTLEAVRGELAGAHLPRIAKLLTLTSDILDLEHKVARAEHTPDKKQAHADAAARAQQLTALGDRLVSEMEWELWEAVQKLHRAMGPCVEGGPEPDKELWDRVDVAVRPLEHREIRLRADFEKAVAGA